MRLLRCKESADRLGVRRSSLPGFERKGLLVSLRDAAGHRRYLESDIESIRAKLLAGELAPAQAAGSKEIGADR